MAKPRTGNVEPQRNGKFLARLTMPDGSRPSLGTFDDEGRAQRVLAAALAELDAPDAITLASFGSTWLNARESMRSHSDQESVWKSRIESAPFYSRELKTIKRHDVVQWVKTSRGAAQTKQNALNLLRQCLSDALECGHIRENPARDIRVPKQARTEDPWTWLRPHELDRLLSVCLPGEREIVRFAVGTGVRAGELAALELADVHASDNEASPHMVVRYGGPGHAPTKGGRPRTVPLFGMALDAIRTWWTYRPKSDRPLVFPSTRGDTRAIGHLLGHVHVIGTRRTKVDRWDVVRYHSGILDDSPDRPLVWHSLRHTCASWLVSGVLGRQWTLQEVQALLGHGEASTTERYAHLCTSLLERAARDHDSPANRQRFAPPGRVELPANGLGSGQEVAEVSGTYPHLLALAGVALRAIESGAREAHDLARALALASLDTRPAEAAAVLAGGPHAFRRAAELAGALLDASAHDGARQRTA